MERERELLRIVNRASWEYICKHEKLGNQFMRKYKEKLSWHIISLYQDLSEDFIEEHQEFVSWRDIFLNQDLSRKFVLRNSHRIDWGEFNNWGHWTSLFPHLLTNLGVLLRNSHFLMFSMLWDNNIL